ncbi:uncharacterized protein E0L32_001937 [Thyridium curvatum]|uniref:Topoisomerase 1-associated factor 1 n=1 Tax=Thyridium curvatum TaxID=1093900 RepID=A0A507ALV9_9PEZI|nr:uncharacterized protein E0L32_001742 [Thyridium curvatum]XP_030990073.1 uncharacterized protein E0L32_001937 [Thyridium curvatum]TPX08167.1 hypothetical protein E0L32_001742 [Thyridium curvatum]TPX08362.1 hypothetical protein E0L32_001937 [Thyridium curvatum]
MELNDVANDTVHPEVRAHINSLVSALGGNSADDDGQYKLGDDALEVLRDIKKWIRFYDEKTNRMDVARCLAEANLIGGDLLQIIALWPENATENRLKARLALACYEIMAPLTWPIEKDPEKMTINHHRHLPVLQLAQLGYKRDIINYDGAQILHTAVRVALPSMAMPIGDRSARDQGIIRLVLFFLRNMAMVAPPPGVKYDGDESQISRSATIDAFSYQDILLTLLTIASNMGDDFRSEDVIVMEIIFHLVKRVEVDKMFLNEQQLNKAKAHELTAVMNKEAAMLRAYNRKAPTRHNRFGTMVWVKRDDGKMKSLSGQDALADAASRELKMDNSKTFRPPRRARRDDMEPKDLGPPVSLNPRANDQLRGFVEEFLDSGFNPLFQQVRKSLDREAPHVLHYHRAQFFYLVAWFLEAERARRKSKKGSNPSKQDDVNSFNLVAGVLNQEMFISLNRAIDRSYNEKDWQELTTVMRCFTQILLTVQEMSESSNEDDQDIAENILNRLFYEESTHDAVANIVRTYKDQGFEYLDACTELTHTYLRILEAYSKQNADLQVRTRRRTRKKKKAAKAAAGEKEEGDQEDADDDSANDEADAQRTTSERKFDFKRFANRFVPQGVVDTFVKFTRFYKDLNDSQLKRAHRYFYRVAFKQDMSVMLFRVDIIHLLYNMIKGPEPLDKSSGVYKDWEELVKQIIRKCVRKIEERPALIIELLFSKINSTAHYLEYGFEKQTIKTNPKPGAELVFRHILERDRQIAVAVGVLLDKGQNDHIDWVKEQLAAAESERRGFEEREKERENALPSVEGSEAPAEGDVSAPPQVKEVPVITIRSGETADDARRTAIFKNSHLRLLMKLVGFERFSTVVDEDPYDLWCVPGSVTADELKESLDLINKAEFDPPTFDNDESAEDQLRRKSAVRKKAAFDDDNDGEELDDDDDLHFPVGPAMSKVADGFIDDGGKPAKKRRRRRKGSEDGAEEELTEEQLDERARRRRDKEREKALKIKSQVYVNPSDDETDDERDREFFRREEALRRKNVKTILGELDDAELNSQPSLLLSQQQQPKKKRKSTVLLDDSDDEEEDVENASDGAGSDSSRARRKKRKSRAAAAASAADSSDEEGGADALSSSARPAARRLQQKQRGPFVDSSDEGDEDDDDVAAVSSQLSAAKRRTGGGGASDDGGDAEDTPMSSSPHDDSRGAPSKTADTSSLSKGAGAAADVDVDMDDDEDDVIATAPARRRVKSGFVLDSSDEE